MNITEILANKGNYGASRKASAIKYIVVHYTANATDTAKANANYFKNNIVKASAHYFVDFISIYRSVPDLYTAWAVGGSKYNDVASTGGASMYKTITNSNSISIELCSNKSVITEQTIALAVELIKDLMKKYNIPVTNVYRHFDVTGKHCPGWNGWFGKDSSKWTAFLNKLKGTSSVTKPSTTPSAPTEKPFTVKIKSTSLNIRKGAGTSYAVVGVVYKGEIYTIVETSGNWGKLKSGKGWISIGSSYVTRL